MPDLFLGLTPRELEVARLVAQDLSNQQIADALFVSYGTVRTHINNMMDALGSRSRVGIAVWYVRNHGTNL